MIEHTPKPWEWLNYPSGAKLLTGPNNAVIYMGFPSPLNISDANQRLIAVAPELLEVCLALVNAESTGQDAYKLAKAVVDKLIAEQEKKEEAPIDADPI